MKNIMIGKEGDIIEVVYSRGEGKGGAVKGISAPISTISSQEKEKENKQTKEHTNTNILHK